MKSGRWIFSGAASLAFAALAAYVTLGDGRAAALVQPATWVSIRDLLLPPSNPLPAAINIVGQVADHGGASTGTIIVRVGSESTQSVGAISPQYFATVSAGNSADMVTIEVEGANFKYVSLLGSYGKLVRQAGSDRILTLDESDALRVSPVSTAFQFFVRRHLNGAALSDSAVERAMRSVLDNDLWLATAVLLRHANGSLTIPAGYANAYEFLQDQAAYSAFLSGNSGISGSEDALAAMTSTGFVDGDFGNAVALLGPVADLNAPMRAPDTQIIESDGISFRVHATASRKNAEFSGGLDGNGALVLAATNDISTYTYQGPCPGGQAWERRRLVGQTYRLQRRSKLASLWLVASDYEVSYPDCDDYPSFNYTAVYFRNAIKLNAEVPFLSGLSGIFGLGRRALPVFCRETFDVPPAAGVYLRSCEYAPHAFSVDGSGQVQELGDKVDSSMSPTIATGSSAFNWSYPARGILEVNDGQVSTRYWSVDNGSAARGLVYVAEAVDGGNVLSLAGYAAMLDGNTQSGFESLPPVGTWRYATFEQNSQELYAYTGRSYTFRFVRRSDGTAVQVQTLVGAATGYETPSRWSLVGGRFYDTRVASDSGDPVYDCAEALAGGATKCAPYSVRYFRPMRRVGNRLYGVEESYVNRTYRDFYTFDPPYELEHVSRPTYHELAPASP